MLLFGYRFSDRLRTNVRIKKTKQKNFTPKQTPRIKKHAGQNKKSLKTHQHQSAHRQQTHSQQTNYTDNTHRQHTQTQTHTQNHTPPNKTHFFNKSLQLLTPSAVHLPTGQPTSPLPIGDPRIAWRYEMVSFSGRSKARLVIFVSRLKVVHNRPVSWPSPESISSTCTECLTVAKGDSGVGVDGVSAV